jgi:predicted nucleic acid-binding protein
VTGPFVLDASATAGWLLEDEADAASEALLDDIRLAYAMVPPHWHVEIANLLRAAERRGRGTPVQIASALAFLDTLPIETDTESLHGLRERALMLSREHGLTAYDAAYLDLAMRLALPLATRDAALRRAASAVGLRVLPS